MGPAVDQQLRGRAQPQGLLPVLPVYRAGWPLWAVSLLVRAVGEEGRGCYHLGQGGCTMSLVLRGLGLCAFK